MRAFWLVSLASLVVGTPSESCRCLYGQSCWPASEFPTLASQVSQPLLHPSPPESACYPASDPSGNCSDVTSNWNSGRWRSGQPGSMQSPNWEVFMFKNGTIDACYLNVTIGLPCTQGSVPVIGVDARTVQDVQAAVKFASTHNLRLVIKNTGHDYLGRSTARGSFMLWMHNLKSTTYNDSFVPNGAPSTETYQAITLGAGVQWYEAYDAVDKQGRFMVGGLSMGGSVGAAGGWIMGAGHSAFSASHGLGVDNVIQFIVVTADGRCLTVNAHKNTDLFWALRGGGGGTYAVVVSATYRTHPKFPIATVSFMANFTSAAMAKSVTAEYVKMHPALADAGWGGYSFITMDLLAFIYVAPNISVTQANATIQPLVNFTSNVNATVATRTAVYDSFPQYYAANFALSGQVGTSEVLGSRLLPRDQAANNSQNVAETMLSVNGGVSINFVAGGAVSKVNPDAMGLHPDWRKTLGLVYFSAGWNEGDPASVIQAVRQQTIAGVDMLDRFTPGSATYFNEASPYEKDFKKTFFGSHYNKLKAIKDKYDPQGLFVVAHGVGSDEWDSSLNCRLP